MFYELIGIKTNLIIVHITCIVTYHFNLTEGKNILLYTLVNFLSMRRRILVFSLGITCLDTLKKIHETIKKVTGSLKS